MISRHSSAAHGKKPYVSIVIPAYNEEENIALCLASLLRQTTSVSMEVIVVDNNSKDRTMKMAEKFRDILQLRVLKEKKQGRGAARRTGFAVARGDIIFSTDADAILPPTWVEKYLARLKKSAKVVAVTGVPAIQEFDQLKNTAFNLSVAQFLKMNYLVYGHPGLSGFGFAIKKWAYEAAGGFDPVVDCYEDLDLAQRVHKIGKIVMVNDPPVTFSGRRFEDGLFKGWAEYMKTFRDMYILKKKRVLLSNPRAKKSGHKK